MKPADDSESAEERDAEQRGGNMVGKGTDRATAHIPSVIMSSVAMGKTEDTCRHNKQGETEEENTDPERPIPDQHGELWLFVSNTRKFPTLMGI